MPVRFPEVVGLRAGPERSTWTDRDSMLYALGIGFGSDPLDRRELPFVYERELSAVPTLATVVGFGPRPLLRSGINYARVVQFAQTLEAHAPLPPAGTAIVESRVTNAVDRGRDSGGLFVTRTVMRDHATEQPIATMENIVLARDDGGFGGPRDGIARLHSVPTRKADLSLDIPTTPSQALLYRLCADRNPLHADPEAAQAAGFPRPILHGLCTYGIACRAVLCSFGNYRPELIRYHAARFSAPVFPGDVLRLDLWRDGNDVSFEAWVESRNSKVLANGLTRLA